MQSSKATIGEDSDDVFWLRVGGDLCRDGPRAAGWRPVFYTFWSLSP